MVDIYHLKENDGKNYMEYGKKHDWKMNENDASKNWKNDIVGDIKIMMNGEVEKNNI